MKSMPDTSRYSRWGEVHLYVETKDEDGGREGGRERERGGGYGGGEREREREKRERERERERERCMYMPSYDKFRSGSQIIHYMYIAHNM